MPSRRGPGTSDGAGRRGRPGSSPRPPPARTRGPRIPTGPPPGPRPRPARGTCPVPGPPPHRRGRRPAVPVVPHRHRRGAERLGDRPFRLRWEGAHQVDRVEGGRPRLPGGSEPLGRGDGEGDPVLVRSLAPVGGLRPPRTLHGDRPDRPGHGAPREKIVTVALAPEPPTLWASACSAPGTWRSPALPRSWWKISYAWLAPVAPIGCPFAFRPPSGLTGRSPPGRVAPDSVRGPAWPGSANPRSSNARSSAMVKQSWTSKRSIAFRSIPAAWNALSAAHRVAAKRVSEVRSCRAR